LITSNGSLKRSRSVSCRGSSAPRSGSPPSKPSGESRPNQVSSTGRCDGRCPAVFEGKSKASAPNTRAARRIAAAPTLSATHRQGHRHPPSSGARIQCCPAAGRPLAESETHPRGHRTGPWYLPPVARGRPRQRMAA
jgi:hypothetical protein